MGGMFDLFFGFDCVFVLIEVLVNGCLICIDIEVEMVVYLYLLLFEYVLFDVEGLVVESLLMGLEVCWLIVVDMLEEGDVFFFEVGEWFFDVLCCFCLLVLCWCEVCLFV